MPRDVPGTHQVWAHVGEGTQQQEAIVQVQQPPQLRLFLDVDLNFEGNQTDDLPQYVPGSGLNGVSMPVPPDPEGTPQQPGRKALQEVRVIAAFVDASGQIVPPPVTQVTFSLQNTSAFPGYAMNAGSSTEPDFLFATGPPQQREYNSDPFTAGFSPETHLSWTYLGVFDYGGFTTARVTAAGFDPVDMQIPLDENNNWISDAGWRLPLAHGGTHIADDVENSGDDSDGIPSGSGPPSGGHIGDGLTRWEEYRGFVVLGEHIRTDPGRKDLFVSIADNLRRQGMLPEEALSYTVNGLWSNAVTKNHIGVRVHRIVGQDDPPLLAREYWLDEVDPEEWGADGDNRRINRNWQNAAGTGQPPDIWRQHAVRIIRDDSASTFHGRASGQCTDGGLVPFNTLRVIVYLAQIETDGMGASETQKNNQVRAVIAHEVGHTIHIRDRGQEHDPGCSDGATTGTGVSVMNSPSAEYGAGANTQGAQFNAQDVPQIRLHPFPRGGP